MRDTIRKARRLRREMSLPELLLWRILRDRPFGLKFRRQHPAGVYILDFYCASVRVAIEIDGEAHNRVDRPERDLIRDNWLAAHGIHTLRIPASDVFRDIEAVVTHIVTLCSPLHQPAAGPPPPQGED